MSLFSAILAGYSVVACCILCLVYLFSLPEMKKTVVGKITCVVMMVCLALLQICHVSFFTHGTDLLANQFYLILLALVPVSFYFFFRTLLFHQNQPSRMDFIHMMPLVLVLVLPGYWAVLSTFLFGCAYTFVICQKVLRLRAHIPRFRFERFFLILFFLMTLVALGLGLALPVMDSMFFYHAYSACISVAMVLVVSALLVFPELLSDVWLASEAAYSKTRLGKINVSEKREQLERLMLEDRVYENEDLTLNSLSDQLELTSHQLSELVNSCFGQSFPRYVRAHRVEAAKRLLLAEPGSSVLSVSVATGFKSQSSFYTAFRELTGEAPAAFRKAHQDTESP